MRYSTIVEKDDKTLLEIIDMLEQFEKDKFIAGLQMRHYSLFQIEQTLDMVRSYQARMNIESRALVNFSESFIQQFATDNNKCFKEAQRYFNRIRSTLCALKKVFQMTCQKSMAQLPEGTENPSVFERSPLGKGAYMVDMYGLASYNDVVQQLYREMETPELLPETDLNKRRRKARSMDDFLKAEYHNVAKQEFKKYVWLEAVRQGRNDGLTEEETFLWPNNHEKVQAVRWAIENFDMMDVEGQLGKLDSVSMVCFLKWCGVEKAKEKRLYQYFCDTYKGRLQPLVWSSISKERKEQRERGVTDRGAAATFQRMLDAASELLAV